jgi:lipid-binding SYLF domain-containing protein
MIILSIKWTLNWDLETFFYGGTAMRQLSFSIGAMATIAMLLAGCTTGPTTSNDQAHLDANAATSVRSMCIQDPGLRPFLDKAYAYVIFPDVGKAAFIAGGAYGWGQVYERGRVVGYADISQATIGLQGGAQGYAELIAFENPTALHGFEAGQLTFSANASAVALKAGAAASAKYDSGVAVFVSPHGGLMLEAAIGGQTFSFRPHEEPVSSNVQANADED